MSDDASKPAPKLGPTALFTLLEEGLDDLVARFREAAPTDPTAGEFVLDKEATHVLTARLISVTSKLHALEHFCGGSLRSISIARAMLHDPITDDEVRAHTVKASTFPGIVSTERGPQQSDVMRSPERPEPPAPRPTHGRDGKLLN